MKRRKQDWSPRDLPSSSNWLPSDWPPGEEARVIFRKWPEGEILAIFPDMEEGPGVYNSYMHVGQHGAASRSVIWHTKPAKLEEYRALAHELEMRGYKLKPIQRWPRES